jgi:hypothetical protein
MKTRTSLALLVILSTAFPGVLAIAQSTDAPSPFDAQKFEDQGRQLLEQFQQPGADPQQLMQQAGQMMQQFREQTAGMTPEQIDQLRTQMMQHLQPLIIKSMPKIIQGMRKGFMDRLKQQLGCTDEEFAVIQPGLQKVIDCSQVLAMANRSRGPGGFGGMAMGIPGQSSPLAQAMADLHATLDDTNASASTIHDKIEAVRKAKGAALHDLEVARAELRTLLTVRQESILVTNGLME